jgi:hypothetical protein
MESIMNAFELVNQAQPTTEVATYGPASIVVSGATLTEKRLGVVSNAGLAAQAYLSAQKGKIGKVAREGLALQGEALIASAARRGNYTPLCEAIASITGETLTISNRASFECLGDRFADKLADLKNGGYTMSKDGTEKSSSKRNGLMQVMALIREVQALAASM